MKDISADMHAYERGFYRHIIPHVVDESDKIVDEIHNY